MRYWHIARTQTFQVSGADVAARVEQLTKTTGDTILLTDQTVDALVARPSGLIDRGTHALKGKSAAIRVFGIDVRAPSSP